MSPNLSRAAAKLVQSLNYEGHKVVREAVRNAVEIDDVSNPVQGWIRDPSSVPDEFQVVRPSV